MTYEHRAVYEMLLFSVASVTSGMRAHRPVLFLLLLGCSSTASEPPVVEQFSVSARRPSSAGYWDVVRLRLDAGVVSVGRQWREEALPPEGDCTGVMTRDGRCLPPGFTPIRQVEVEDALSDEDEDRARELFGPAAWDRSRGAEYTEPVGPDEPHWSITILWPITSTNGVHVYGIVAPTNTEFAPARAAIDYLETTFDEYRDPAWDVIDGGM